MQLADAMRQACNERDLTTPDANDFDKAWRGEAIESRYGPTRRPVPYAVAKTCGLYIARANVIGKGIHHFAIDARPPRLCVAP